MSGGGGKRRRHVASKEFECGAGMPRGRMEAPGGLLFVVDALSENLNLYTCLQRTTSFSTRERPGTVVLNCFRHLDKSIFQFCIHISIILKILIRKISTR